MLWPAAVELGGVSVSLADVLADITLYHGRADISDEPTASTCQLTLADVDKEASQAFSVGQSLRVTVSDGGAPAVPRFTGRVTDGSLVDDELTIIGAGAVSTLGGYEIGAGDYPQEAWSARVSRVFGDAGLGSLLELHADPLLDPLLAARTSETAGETTLGDYLAFLARMVGAAVTDTPDGRILVQAVGARTLDGAYTLDPADVAFTPAWTEELPRGNIVTVRYTGDQSEHVTVTDPVSIDRYGERPETIDTSFVHLADADYRARQRLSRSAFSHWNMPAAPILRGLELTVGEPIVLAGMPAASPFDPWTPTLEGWNDSISGDAWTMTLSLSDPLLSGLTIPWDDVPPSAEYLWNTVDVETDWTEALTLEALNAG